MFSVSRLRISRMFSHEDKLSTVRTNGMCINCMCSDHFVKACRSSHRRSVCQKPHHTLLHIENNPCPSMTSMVQDAALAATPAAPITASHVATGIKSEMLLMTCRVRVEAQDGFTMEARPMLDSGSSPSFISEHLARSLRLLHQSKHENLRSCWFCSQFYHLVHCLVDTFPFQEVGRLSCYCSSRHL